MGIYGHILLILLTTTLKREVGYKNEHKIGPRSRTVMAYAPLEWNFEADLSMMVSRSYEANLGRNTQNTLFSKFAKKVFVETLLRLGRDWIPAGRGS